jgi:hypothetical protein
MRLNRNVNCLHVNSSSFQSDLFISYNADLSLFKNKLDIIVKISYLVPGIQKERDKTNNINSQITLKLLMFL